MAYEASVLQCVAVCCSVLQCVAVPQHKALDQVYEVLLMDLSLFVMSNNQGLPPYCMCRSSCMCTTYTCNTEVAVGYCL